MVTFQPVNFLRIIPFFRLLFGPLYHFVDETPYVRVYTRVYVCPFYNETVQTLSPIQTHGPKPH